MDKKVYDNYVKLLHDELTMATGCTEPIAIAYAGAKLREVLGDIPEHCTVYCSGNIVKNVMSPSRTRAARAALTLPLCSASSAATHPEFWMCSTP